MLRGYLETNLCLAAPFLSPLLPPWHHSVVSLGCTLLLDSYLLSPVNANRLCSPEPPRDLGPPLTLCTRTEWVTCLQCAESSTASDIPELRGVRNSLWPRPQSELLPNPAGAHLGCWDGEPAPVVGTGPGLLPQGHQLLDVLHLHQDAVPEELQLPVAIEGTGGPGLPSAPLGRLGLGRALHLWGRHGAKAERAWLSCGQERACEVKSTALPCTAYSALIITVWPFTLGSKSGSQTRH